MIEQSENEAQLAALLIDALDLEDISPRDIGPNMLLFGNQGNGCMGLDSIDALELGMALQTEFGVIINAEDENTREYFRSVKNLAQFVASQQT